MATGDLPSPASRSLPPHIPRRLSDFGRHTIATAVVSSFAMALNQPYNLLPVCRVIYHEACGARGKPQEENADSARLAISIFEWLRDGDLLGLQTGFWDRMQ